MQWARKDENDPIYNGTFGPSEGYGTLKTGDLKNDIPDLAHRSWGGFL